jgi:hypothetical protein
MPKSLPKLDAYIRDLKQPRNYPVKSIKSIKPIKPIKPIKSVNQTKIKQKSNIYP